MSNTLLIFTEEGVKRVIAGLSELPSKISHDLLNDIESQLGLIKSDIKKYVSLVEEHFSPHKDEAAKLAPVPPKAETDAVAA